MNETAAFVGLVIAYAIGGLITYFNSRSTREKVSTQEDRLVQLERQRTADQDAHRKALSEKEVVISHLQKENAKLNHVSALYDTLNESHGLLQVSHEQLEERVEGLSRQVEELTKALDEKNRLLAEKERLYAEAISQLTCEREQVKLLQHEISVLKGALKLVGAKVAAADAAPEPGEGAGTGQGTQE